ncbi:MAG: hypothetical protein M1335_07655 [Chloroflexi bacterium]|nr:hypothetical protein [Chloroflexota bacterium]MCL5105254.1 hypothetical protein [Armatimonadota bacterium]
MANASTIAEQAEETMEKAEETTKERRSPVRAAMALPEKASSPFYIGMTAGSIILSLILYGLRKKEDAIFVGHWAPTFLALGLFTKLVSGMERKQA